MSAPTRNGLTLSRWQLELFTKCPRCFWLLKQHGIQPPASYPLALNTAMDGLLKAEFDQHRRAGTLHPILSEQGIRAELFRNAAKLQEWRDARRGVRWMDPATGYTFFGAVDDILEFPDGSLAVVDYKSSGAREVTVYPSYQLQIDIYTFLLEKLGYKTAPTAYLAFFLAIKNDGFKGRLPFRAELKEVTPAPERVYKLFLAAAEAAQAEQVPPSGEECDLCRWFGEAHPRVSGPK